MAREDVETAIALLEEIRADLRKIAAGTSGDVSVGLQQIDARLEEVEGVLDLWTE
jgi:hypothetical protein